MVLERLKRMVVKESIQAFRNPRMKAMIIAMPLVQLLIFGYAISTDVRDAAVAVHDQDRSPASRELAARLVASGRFLVTEPVRDDAEARALLDRGAVRAVLHVGPGFGAEVSAGRPAAVQLLADGTDSNTARVVAAYAAAVLARWNEDLAGRRPLVRLETRAWFNENLESRTYLVPGIIAALVMLITLNLTAMAVARERELGTIEQIMVTPITRAEFILGKTLPFGAIALVDVLLITAVGTLWFGVPIRGSLPLLFGCSCVYVVTCLGVGLLLSTVCDTQQQAMLSVFMFYFPAMLLSGFMFPVANMPLPVQWLSALNPLRWFLVVVRGIFLKGVGLDVLWPELAILAAMGAACLWLAAGRFRKTFA